MWKRLNISTGSGSKREAEEKKNKLLWQGRTEKKTVHASGKRIMRKVPSTLGSAKIQMTVKTHCFTSGILIIRSVSADAARRLYQDTKKAHRTSKMDGCCQAGSRPVFTLYRWTFYVFTPRQPKPPSTEHKVTAVNSIFRQCSLRVELNRDDMFRLQPQERRTTASKQILRQKNSQKKEKKQRNEVKVSPDVHESVFKMRVTSSIPWRIRNP